MREKQKKLIHLLLFLIVPLLFSLIYHLNFSLSFKETIDNIYTIPLENEVFIYGKVLLNHGIIKVKESDNWEKLLAKIKKTKNGYILKDNNYTKKIPMVFLIQKKVNLDNFFIKEKMKKYDGKKQTKPKRERRRGLRYR